MLLWATCGVVVPVSTEAGVVREPRRRSTEGSALRRAWRRQGCGLAGRDGLLHPRITSLTTDSNIKIPSITWSFKITYHYATFILYYPGGVHLHTGLWSPVPRGLRFMTKNLRPAFA